MESINESEWAYILIEEGELGGFPKIRFVTPLLEVAVRWRKSGEGRNYWVRSMIQSY